MITEQAESYSAHTGLMSKDWDYSYRTSASTHEGRKVNILHDFYIPALSLSTSYDRMAGYFRSSSLAAASQGFSAFIGKRGRIRLVVGADLDLADVEAILEGDIKLLEARLNGELEHPGKWPEEVKNGVGLLAWMVANGYLEVKVAFRIHGETGKPLAFSVTEDGYVHEKWAIFTDESNDHLYASGFLNESRSALILNAENVDVHCDWWSERDRQRVNDAAAAFENIWNDRNPFLRVITLPEAVKHRLLKIAESVIKPTEIDGSGPLPIEVQPPSALELFKFNIIRDGPRLPGGRFVGMETAPVAPWPHQSVVARRLIEGWPFSYLLCDEVGLGKTIEAGLAIRSLYLSGVIRRVLIAVPASLTMQWQRQMASKLLMPFARALGGAECRHSLIFPREEERSSASIYGPDLVIVSTGLMIRKERIPSLDAGVPFDITLIDEAHAARRKNPTGGTTANPEYGHLYRVIRDHLRLKTPCLWMATATPMQIDPVEVCDLLELTNRVGPFQFDPALTLQYYDILGRLVREKVIKELEWEFLRQSVKSLAFQDPLLWEFIERSVIDGRIRLAAQQWLEKGMPPRGSDRKALLKLIFSASPLSRVMLRHTRSLLDIYSENNQLGDSLPQRHILPLRRITFNRQEKEAYDSLEAYCLELARKMETHLDNQTRYSLGFLLSFLRLRFASSLFSIRETLRRRLEKVEATLRRQAGEDEEEWEPAETYPGELLTEGEEEDDREAVVAYLKKRTVADLEWECGELKAMLARMEDISGTSSKMLTLLDLLDKRRISGTGRIRQTVIFTRFYDTLTDIVDSLLRIDPEMRVGTYSGKGGQYLHPHTKRLNSVDREEVKERFLRGEIDILVCTDAAAEGLNLQTADMIANFDLGWNPMKIEQRIGRIDRIGQRNRDVYVINLCYAGSAEEIVYGRLLSRLTESMMIVGRQQFAMLPVKPDEFLQLAEGKLKEEKLAKIAMERIQSQQQRMASMEIPPEDLYKIYLRLAEESDSVAAPVDLEAVWTALTESRYLKDLGCKTVQGHDSSILAVHGIDGVPEGALLTVSRKLYEEGIPEAASHLHFASYLDPYFEAILDQTGKFDLPGCIRRISVEIPEMNHLEVIAYACVCTGESGSKEVRFITSWKHLDGLQLCEGENLSDAEMELLRQRLHKMALGEFNKSMTAKRVEKYNTRAASAQKTLGYLVIQSLIKTRSSLATEGHLFWPMINDLNDLFDKREKIYIPDLPADVARIIEERGDPLFRLTIPTVGSKATLEAPTVLLRPALDSVTRLAASMKVRRAELSTNNVLARLQREIDQCLEQLTIL